MMRTSTVHASSILVVGSMNVDTFLPVARLPGEGENLSLRPGSQPVVDVPGGKGCTQAVAAAKLLVADGDPSSSISSSSSSESVFFVGQFGNDAAAQVLQSALEMAGVDIHLCGHHDALPSGRGYVFLTESGSVSAVISGGSNADEGWKSWRTPSSSNNNKNNEHDNTSENYKYLTDQALDALLDGKQCILLQREVPEYVNLRIASRAKKRGGIIVIQDVGGEDRPMTREMLELCDYVVPNESELQRLIQTITTTSTTTTTAAITKENARDDATIVRQAALLRDLGARNVLVTRGSRGSTLVTESGQILQQPAFRLPQSRVLDETGAGDCYRAAFAVSLLEGHSLEYCMKFASAAGSCSVEVQGAVPSTPTRAQVEHRVAQGAVFTIPRGDGQGEAHGLPPRGGAIRPNDKEDDKFPFLIGSRLNSMKDRPEIWTGPLKTPHDYVQRQATIRGLTCVDFNYPQHFLQTSSHNGDAAKAAKAALDEAGLVAGAVCLRYPSPEFARGAMNHPDEKIRRKAIDLTKQAAQAALDLGCDEVVIWSAFDGYDYPFQVDYDEKWAQIVAAFQEICDAFPAVKFSLEFKPTDENTRFFTVPTTAAALLLVDEIDRLNMGLTMDVGHMLMAGENPGQSIAMVGRKKKLFGIQLNDGYTRLAAEDGLMFGSVHPATALEIMYQMRRVGFSGHFYFDTFPQRTDPVKEAEYNIRQLKRFWSAAGAIDIDTLKKVVDEHDAIGALEIVNTALRSI
jgi:sugar/nucleoside kinase (ribokinase family)/sugar phosphate isomerase/epimerase